MKRSSITRQITLISRFLPIRLLFAYLKRGQSTENQNSSGRHQVESNHSSAPRQLILWSLVSDLWRLNPKCFYNGTMWTICSLSVEICLAWTFASLVLFLDFRYGSWNKTLQLPLRWKQEAVARFRFSIWSIPSCLSYQTFYILHSICLKIPGSFWKRQIQKPEGRWQKSEVRESDVRSQIINVMSSIRNPASDSWHLPSDIRHLTSEFRLPTSEFCLLTSGKMFSVYARSDYVVK